MIMVILKLQLLKRWILDSAILISLMLIHWMAIDPMDSAIQLLLNWGKIVILQASHGEGVGKNCLQATLMLFYKNINAEI